MNRRGRKATDGTRQRPDGWSKAGRLFALMLAVPASANATTPPTEPVTTTARRLSTTTPAEPHRQPHRRRLRRVRRPRRPRSTPPNPPSRPARRPRPPSAHRPPSPSTRRTPSEGETEEDRGVVEPGGSFRLPVRADVLRRRPGLREPHDHRHLPGRGRRRRGHAPARHRRRPRRHVGGRVHERSPSSTPRRSLSPSGQLGMAAGGSDDFTVDVTLPTDTTLSDGAVIINEAYDRRGQRRISAGGSDLGHGQHPARRDVRDLVVETTEVTETTEGGPGHLPHPRPDEHDRHRQDEHRRRRTGR